MRKINFEEYNKKRKKAKIDILELRDQLNKKKTKTKRSRQQDKQYLLYKLAKKRKEKMIEKVGNHLYRFK
ncbi:hypothetical protein DFR79_10720 [Halanaerobium saccharolyticum]|uniref:Uncharacterized protein n=1 Tax=Halanaerobium saccharolyticum TaxID=43595 RepID=A0A4R6LTU6_9FIRM|nr:hypothetical protein [Halanaerobium saccharolyticum]TDO92118.1 hypothetical protein DFR79_10720 [Halanaerobium saccharolyticum]